MAVWFVRPRNRNTTQDNIAFENCVLLIGWEEMPDLSRMKDKEELVALYIKKFPQASGRVPVIHGGILWAFSHQIQRRDIAVFALTTPSRVAVGEVTGSYEYRNDLGRNCRHAVPVKWIHKAILRAAFDKELQYSFRSLIQIYQVRRENVEERILKTCLV